MKAENTDSKASAAPLTQSEISDAADKQLLSQTVDNLTYDLLTDEVQEKGMDLQADFIAKTVEMTKDANDEMWRMQWDAVQNLRIVNKFYYEAICG